MARIGRPPGPPPTPTPLRLVKGNPGHRPLPENEPQPEQVPPEKPDWLGEVASKEWDRITYELAALGLVTRLDRAALVSYCRAWAAVVKLEKCIDVDGWRVATGNGGWKRNPDVASLNEAWRRIYAMAAEFGMTPAARSRIDAPGRKPADPLEELSQRRRNGR